MTVQQRRALGLVGVVAALVALVLALTSGGDDDRIAVRGVAENAPSTTTSTTAPDDDGTNTTVPLVPVTTGVPVPNATEAPPSTAPPSATPAAPRAATGPAAGATGAADGTVVTSEGATLTRSPSGATRSVDKAKGCTSATASDGWKIEDCGALRTSGTVLLWLVETKGKASRALVLKEQTSGRWLIVLSAADVNGATFAKIGVRGEDVSGDGQPELVFGFHRKDAASTLSMDVVDASPAVVVHRDLAKGAVRLAKGEITTWAAAADGAYDQVAIRFSAGAWRAGAAQSVPRSAVPASMI